MSPTVSAAIMHPAENRMPVDLSVCVPVYNEKLALRQSIVDLKQVLERLPYSYEIIIIDDGSSDDCVETVRDLGIRLIRHRRNLGAGIARMTGLRYAQGRMILQSDADGTYPCERIPEMLDRLGRADMVIGARNRESATDWRWLRIMMKTFLKLLASMLAGHPIPDLNSGMRAYYRDGALRYGYLYPPGHSIMSTMTLGFISDGLKVDFIEIDYHVRKGKSSFHPFKDTYNYLITILRTIVYFAPMRVLMPAVLGVGAIALIFTVRNLIQFSSLGAVPILLWVSDLLLFVLALQSDQFSRISRQMSFQDPLPPYHRDVYEDPSFSGAGSPGVSDTSSSKQQSV